MKKILLKSLAVVLLFAAACLFVVSCRDVMASAREDTPLNYLVIGLDDAAGNSDIIMLLGVTRSGDKITVLQIPRDTYYAYGGGKNKINGVFAAYRATGMSEREALGAFSDDLENILGVDITASFAVTIPAFKRFVSQIGGVSVDMPCEFTFTDERGFGGFSLKAGENLLDADMAETFVRYRRTYALGDLSRINAQKIFFSGMLKKVTGLGFAKLAAAVLSIRENLYTDCDFSDIAKILVKKPGRKDEIAARFITLPGEAVMSEDGGSYFSVNRKNSEKVLRLYFASDSFDAAGALLKSGEPAFYNVYYDENASYLEYNDNDLDSIKLR